MKRLLTIGHSYAIAANRRLAHEMAVQGRGQWDVTAAAPERLAADLRDVVLEPIENEACAVRSLGVRIGFEPHLRHYDRRLRSLLADEWDVVHVWEEPYVAAGAQIAAAAPAGARLVPATFQNIAKRYPFPFSHFERRVMSRAAGWIAFGQTVHETQQPKPLYAAKPSRVISPGVDTCRFKPNDRARSAIRAHLGWDDRIPVVGFLGRFVPEKGLATLMTALQRAGAPWRALFVGGGPMMAQLSTFRMAHPDRVRILTGVTHDEVPAHLNAMDVLCAPSEATSRWREQFGRMLIEAMASSVPVIATRSGEIPHVVNDTAVLVEERNADALSAAIDRLLRDPIERARLSARGVARAHGTFAWPVVARAHLDFFESLL